MYLVTAVVTSELAARMRRRAAEAERRERDAALLADLAARLLERGDLTELVERAKSSTDPAGVRFDQAVASLVAIAGERERLEREALETETLRRTDAIKTAVIQSVSHDLRTPLATIEAALDGLQSPTISLEDQQQAELLDSVRNELQRLERYVENLLDLSRLQAGAATPAQAIWTADALAEQALDELRDGDRVRVEVPADLPPIRTDAAQVQRALVNVLENALKFSPSQTTVTFCAPSGEATTSSFASTTMGRASPPTKQPRSSSRSTTLAGVAARGSGSRSRAGSSPPTAADLGRAAASGGASFVVALPLAELTPVAT